MIGENIISLREGIKKLTLKKERKIGRYNVSDIWAMLNGYLPIEQYTKTDELDNAALVNVFLGTEKHTIINKLLNSIYPEGIQEQKIEKDFGDFVIVGRADFIVGDKIVEIKTSNVVMSTSKTWHDYQLSWYLWLFNKPVGLIVQPLITYKQNKPEDICLKIIKKLKVNPVWCEQELKKLKDYHNKLKKWEIQNTNIKK